ncbi:recombinase family protein, partial [Candidatus Omnitrophota bacterium]
SLNADGLTSRTSKKWGTTSIEKILHNEAYTGTLVWGRRTKNHGQAENDALLQRTEDAWSAIVDLATFTQAQAKLSGRATQAIHPRQVDSAYMLSGNIRCGICGAAMIGQGNSSRYRYYMCGNARIKGREVCPSPILPGNKIERVVVDHIKDYILTEENLEELVRLTNEELTQTNSEDRESLGIIEGQIADVESRLGKLYDASETGKFKSGELAPRIRTLTQQKEELQRVKANIEERLRHEVLDTVDLHVVQPYTSDLRNLLAKSSINEQRSFLKSFVEKIEVDDEKAKMYYTIPVPSDNISQETTGVLSFVHHG